MGRDNWRPERIRYSPWGALALVLLTGLALMRSGDDHSPGPPQSAAATSAGHRMDTAAAPVAGPAVKPSAYAPGARVHGDTGKAEPRVVTRGGGFTKAGGHDGDVVVLARPVGTR
ncbi:hypothetical protein ACGFR8_36015 [Streptomyces brevispora]|uniref:hypothetical protein n=1 Tax=Streptomyces brevispora TaxID=887462 RepID=UPI003716FC88